MQNVVWFKDVDKGDIAIVGGKGANLGELTKIGAPIPDGFIVTSQAYFDAVKNSGALDRIKGILYGQEGSTSKLIKITLPTRACQYDTSYSGLPCDAWLNLSPGIYKLYVLPWGKKSNEVSFVIE